jgi:thiamine-monophosphate kinase
MDERERIAMLARVLAGRVPGVTVGIGDDAAVLDGGGTLVWTIDEQVEGVHFRRDLVTFRELGFRSLMAAASDVAAMGGRPWCALCAMAVPADVDDAQLEAIATGQHEAAEELHAGVVGGNLSRGPALSLSTTVLGRCQRAIQRKGAHVGEGIWLAGPVGLAAAGLRALGSGEVGKLDDPRLQAAIAAWRTPRALVEAGRAMGLLATSAIDVSDGLARDVGHLAEASGLCGVLDEASLTDPELLAAADALGLSAIELALHGGEDYALVATSAAPLPGFRRIGKMREGTGLVLRAASGERPLEPRGFDHFAGA